MASSLPPELQTVLSRVEVGRLQNKPSWRAILPVEEVAPTYNVTHIKTDKNIIVTRSRRGELNGPRSSPLVQDRESNPMMLFKARIDIPWFDEWMAKRRAAATGTLPIPVGPLDNVNPVRLFAEMIDQAERNADSFFWDGDTGENILGMTDQDASPAGNNATIDTLAGRQEFVANVAAARQASKRQFLPGNTVLAIDASIEHWLDFPYQEGGGAGGKSAREVLQGTQPGQLGLTIVPVEIPSFNGKAMLSYRDITNGVYYDSTPEGYQSLIFGADGDDKQLVIFRQYGLAVRRDNATSKNWPLFVDLAP
jgi:hypothetical protein